MNWGRGWFKRTIQTRVWGMDIHPSARIASSALIDRTWPRGIHIGADCEIYDHAVILTHDMTRGVYADTIIGARVKICQRAIILPGVEVGPDCIVLPGAVVTKSMPAGTIAIGNPATIEPLGEASYGPISGPKG